MAIDMRDPSHPAPQGQVPLPGSATKIQVVGDLAYVISPSQGLTIVNVHNSSAPAVVGSFVALGQARDLQVVGTLAYIGEYDGPLQIIDVSNPSDPVLRGSFASAQMAEVSDVEIVGSQAYLATTFGNSGLQILDLSDPIAPRLLGYYETLQGGRDVETDGKLAYLTTMGSEVFEIYVSDPTSPTLNSWYKSVDSGGMRVVGDRLYMLDLSGNLLIFHSIALHRGLISL